MFLTFLINPEIDRLINGYGFNKYPYNDKPLCGARSRTKDELRLRIEDLENTKNRILSILKESESHKQKEFRLHLIDGIDRKIKRNSLYLRNYYLIRLRAFIKAFT